MYIYDGRNFSLFQQNLKFIISAEGVHLWPKLKQISALPFPAKGAYIRIKKTIKLIYFILKWFNAVYFNFMTVLLGLFKWFFPNELTLEKRVVHIC